MLRNELTESPFLLATSSRATSFEELMDLGDLQTNRVLLNFLPKLINGRVITHYCLLVLSTRTKMSTVAGYHAQPVPLLFYFVSFLFRIRFVFQFLT